MQYCQDIAKRGKHHGSGGPPPKGSGSHPPKGSGHPPPPKDGSGAYDDWSDFSGDWSDYDLSALFGSGSVS